MLIVDDHPLSGRALGVTMGSLPGLKVMGETTRHDAIRRTVQLAPDVVVWHTEDLDRESLGVIRSISTRPAASRVLVLGAADVVPLALKALRAGASGFLPDSSTPEEFMPAIRAVAVGGAAISPRLTHRLIEFLRARPVDVFREWHRLDTLTSREREVLSAMARGWTNTETAQHMCLAPTTVKTHVSRILTKTGARDRLQAVVLALNARLTSHSKNPPAA
ncbi:response regulator transcription factor [Streptomyces mirabilis]|uniref:response regulator transcription factor n=1 Tax=Streptomyces mirabilis TaxID=68239 RepID=UPI0033326EB5